MTARPLAVTLSTSVALVALSGCMFVSTSSPEPPATSGPAATTVSAPPAAPPATGSPAATPSTGAPAGASAVGDSVQVDGRTISGVAPGLEFPPGTTVKDAFAGGVTSTVIISAPQPSVALAYYRVAAPKAGYTLLTDVGSLLTLEHRNGWNVTIIGQSTDVTINFNAP